MRSRLFAMSGWLRGNRRVLAPVVPVASVTAAIALSLLAAVPAAVGAPVGSGVAVSSSQAQRAMRFWTRARMERAKPLAGQGFGDSPAGLGGSGGSSGETPHRYPAAAPSGEASSSSLFETVPDPTELATRQNGAIFIELPFGLARCSGTSVNAPNLSVVFTAGHCVNTGGKHGEWFDHRWVFVPAYRYRQRPFGVFPAKWIDTTPKWRSTGSENFDIGAAVVGRNEHGELLGKAVGGAGIAWDLKARQIFDVHGYPVAPPFDGETQQVCTQTTFLGHDARSFLSPGPLNLAVDCDVTGGASGGGWTIAGDILNSVTNYGYPDDPATDFGAYFGKEAGRLFSRAASIK
jgi:V8-like Glu-specific endopeptidase